MKSVSELDLIERELEDRVRQQILDKQTLEKTILETAADGGLAPNNPPQSLWRWNIHRIRHVCMVLEERGLLVYHEGVYTKHE